MKILFISQDLIAGNLAYLLKKEGHTVKLYIEDRERRQNFEGLVTKVTDWKNELDWVGKNGLIIFDDVGWGKDQEWLRKQGYSVFGSSHLGDKFEQDREYGQKIFQKYGIKTSPLKDFKNVRSALNFVRKNKCSWVIKQNNHHYSKVLNYVGDDKYGRDVASVLQNNIDNPFLKNEKISLHKKIDGVEMGVGRYFNGTDWVGPIEINLEHTRLFPGDLGPLTSEMGTLAWYTNDEETKIYKDTLAKLKDYLQSIDFRGDVAVNCIVNHQGAYALEATTRFGSPIVHLQTELQKSPWGDFLKAVADGKQYSMKFKKGYGIVTLVAVPPFPHGVHDKSNLLSGVEVYFDKATKKDFDSIHFEEVSKKRVRGEDHYYISDNRGYILYVTSVGDTIKKAHDKNIKTIHKICIPKMFYRDDIGTKFDREQKEKLEKWGYL